MRMFAPLTVAYGAWDDLEGRGDLGVDAKAVKEYCGRSFLQMAQAWRWPEGLATLLQYSEAWTGGLTMPCLSRKANVRYQEP